MPTPLRVLRFRSRRPRRFILVFVLLFLFIGVPGFIRFAANWMWFQNLGYQSVFTTQIIARALLGLGVGAAAFVFLYANLRLAMRGISLDPLLVIPTPGGPIELMRIIRRLALVATLFVTVLMGLGAAGAWLDVLRFMHRLQQA